MSPPKSNPRELILSSSSPLSQLLLEGAGAISPCNITGLDHFLRRKRTALSRFLAFLLMESRR
jgi:hypothetical protein